jgi:hypothetical protein
MAWIKVLCKAGIFLLAVYFLSKFCHQQTDGFSISRIQSTLSSHPEWENTQPEPPELKLLFDQRFTYLGSGGQAFVFSSEDGNYILKFFKHYKRELPGILTQIPLPQPLDEIRSESLDRKRLKTKRDFDSYRLAFDLIKEETGLVWIHLNKTTHLRVKTTLIDKLGIAHPLNLDDYEWILQKRAELLYPKLQKLISQGEMQQAENVIHAVIDAVIARSKKGVVDDDPGFHKNLGFIGDQVVFIDTGRMRKDSSPPDLKQMTQKLSTWLEQESPPLALALQRKLNDP